jgi:hypothetical protein
MRGDGLDPEAVVAFAIILFLVLAAVIAGYLLWVAAGRPGLAGVPSAEQACASRDSSTTPSTTHELNRDPTDLERRSDRDEYQSVPRVARLVNQRSPQFVAHGPFRGEFGRGLFVYEDSLCGMHGAANSEK